MAHYSTSIPQADRLERAANWQQHHGPRHHHRRLLNYRQLPFKTDGFDVTGTNIAITDSVIFNGDDAIAVQSGSHNEPFQYGTIGYQTHGMSIGSLAKGQGAYVNVSDITAGNAVHAARFKS